jgi:GNAT superfamily N-acetyltransferase
VLVNATPAQLELAAADNHRQLFTLEAIAANGELQSTGGLSWTYAGPDKGATIPFPALSKDDAGDMLDAMMAWFRTHPPKNAGCWSLEPPQPADLGVKLLARGFQPGWQPCWMALRLADMRDHPAPPTLEICPDNDIDTSTVRGLPYAGSNGAVPPSLIHAFPGRAQRFLAFMNGKIVGQSCVFLTTGAYGVAGIYNEGVVPEARHQGIGKAVLRAACRFAAGKGYHYAILNGTGRRMYEQTGFQWISYGRTWWLNNRGYITHPPSPASVMLAEAIGLGDLAGLESIGKQFSTVELNTPLASEMTLMELAMHCHQPLSAEWLVEHGAAYTVLDAWDLGWKERTAALLSAQPSEANRRYSYLQNTILHIAAERNDMHLAVLALSAKPDLQIRDKIYHGTPLDWARHFGRTEIIELIEGSLRFRV